MVEARCPHKILRSVVECPACGPLLRGPAAELEFISVPLSDRPDFVDMTGLTIGGSVVTARALSENGKSNWWCLCPCGERYVVQGRWLRIRQKSGQAARCQKCRRRAIPKEHAGGVAEAYRIDEVATPPAQPAKLAPYRKRLEADARARRAVVLREVRKAFTELPVVQFDRWLDEQLGIGVRSVG